MRLGVKIVGVLALVLCVGCGEKALDRPTGPLRDAEGRFLVLHGVNVGSKQPPDLGWHTREDFANLKKWGFNSVRLLVIWAGVEPQPGVYDETYLQGLDERIAWAKESGLHVVLDMHQDLYGEKIPGGDGAPAWATLDEGKAHIHVGSVWSMAYYTSPMVQTAFDNFWANKPAEDGIGLQDHYAAMWRHVAQRYADEPAIVGYDLMNEPFIGSKIGMALAAVVPKLAEGMGLTMTDVATNPGRIFEDSGALLAALGEPEVFSALHTAAAPIFQDFERTKLQPMYEKVTAAIREVDGIHAIFIEPSVSSNMGIPSAIMPVRAADGSLDPLQVFAPHAYDLVTDTDQVGETSMDRMNTIVKRQRDHAREIGLPLYVGEWGAYYGSADVAAVARQTVALFNSALAGTAYWDYHPNFDQTGFFQHLSRPVPHAIAGTLQHVLWDANSRRLEVFWTEDRGVQAPSRFYVPAAWYPKGYRVEVTPAGKGYREVEGEDSSPNRYIEVPPTNEIAGRTLKIIPVD